MTEEDQTASTGVDIKEINQWQRRIRQHSLDVDIREYRLIDREGSDSIHWMWTLENID
jgi:hypothetical protein